MTHTFTAKRISSDDNVLYPDIIVIDNETVAYGKSHVIGSTTLTLSRSNIASVRMETGLFFANVIITSKGGEWIKAQGFSKRDARTILQLLTNY